MQTDLASSASSMTTTSSGAASYTSPPVRRTRCCCHRWCLYVCLGVLAVLLMMYFFVIPVVLRHVLETTSLSSVMPMATQLQTLSPWTSRMAIHMHDHGVTADVHVTGPTFPYFAWCFISSVHLEIQSNQTNLIYIDLPKIDLGFHQPISVYGSATVGPGHLPKLKETLDNAWKAQRIDALGTLHLVGRIHYSLFGIPMMSVSFQRPLEMNQEELKNSYHTFKPFLPEFNVQLERVTNISTTVHSNATELNLGLILNNTSPFQIHFPGIALPVFIERQPVFLLKSNDTHLYHGHGEFRFTLYIYDLTNDLGAWMRRLVSRFQTRPWTSMEVGVEGPIHMSVGEHTFGWVTELTSSLALHATVESIFAPFLLSSTTMLSAAARPPHLVFHSYPNGIGIQLFPSLAQLEIPLTETEKMDILFQTTLYLDSQPLVHLGIKEMRLGSTAGQFHSITLGIDFLDTTFAGLHEWAVNAISATPFTPPVVSLGDWKHNSTLILKGFQLFLNPFFPLLPEKDVALHQLATLLSHHGGVHFQQVANTMVAQLAFSSLHLPVRLYGELPVSFRLSLRVHIANGYRDFTFAHFQLTPVLQGIVVRFHAQLQFINHPDLQSNLARIASDTKLSYYAAVLFDQFRIGKARLPGELPLSIAELGTRLYNDMNASLLSLLDDTLSVPISSLPSTKHQLGGAPHALPKKDVSCLRHLPSVSNDVLHWTPILHRVVVQPASMVEEGKETVQVDLFVQPPFWVTHFFLGECRAALQLETTKASLLRFQFLPLQYTALQNQERKMKFTFRMIPEWQHLSGLFRAFFDTTTSSSSLPSITFTGFQFGSIQTFQALAIPLTSSSTSSSSSALSPYVTRVLDWVQFQWSVDVSSQIPLMSALATWRVPSLSFQWLIHLPIYMQVHLQDDVSSTPSASSSTKVIEISAQVFMSSCQPDAFGKVGMRFMDTDLVQAHWDRFFTPSAIPTLVQVHGIQFHTSTSPLHPTVLMSMTWTQIVALLTPPSLNPILELAQHIDVFPIPEKGIQIDTVLRGSLFPYLHSITLPSISAFVHLVGTQAAAQVHVLPWTLHGGDKGAPTSSSSTPALSVQFVLQDVSHGASPLFFTNAPWGLRLAHVVVGPLRAFAQTDLVHAITFPTEQPDRLQAWSRFVQSTALVLSSTSPKLTLSVLLDTPTLPFTYSIHVPLSWVVQMQVRGPEEPSVSVMRLETDLKFRSDRAEPIDIDVWFLQDEPVQNAVHVLANTFFHADTKYLGLSLTGLDFASSKVFSHMVLLSTTITSLDDIKSAFSSSLLPVGLEGVRVTRLPSKPSAVQVDLALTAPFNQWKLARVAISEIRVWLTLQHRQLVQLVVPAFEMTPTSLTFPIQVDMTTIALDQAQRLLDTSLHRSGFLYVGFAHFQVGVIQTFQKINVDVQVSSPGPLPAQRVLRNAEFKWLPSGIEMEGDLHVPWRFEAPVDVSAVFPISVRVKTYSTVAVVGQWEALEKVSPDAFHFRVSVQTPEELHGSVAGLEKFLHELVLQTGPAYINVTGLTVGASPSLAVLAPLHWPLSIRTLVSTFNAPACTFQAPVRATLPPPSPSDPTIGDRETTYFVRQSKDAPGFDIAIRALLPDAHLWLKTPFVIDRVGVRLLLNRNRMAEIAVTNLTISNTEGAVITPTLRIRFASDAKEVASDFGELIHQVLRYVRRDEEVFHDFPHAILGVTGFQLGEIRSLEHVQMNIDLQKMLPVWLCPFHPFFTTDYLDNVSIGWYEIFASVRLPTNVGIDLRNLRTSLYFYGRDSGDLGIPHVSKAIGENRLEVKVLLTTTGIKNGWKYFNLAFLGIGFYSNWQTTSTKASGYLDGIIFDDQPLITMFSQAKIII